MATDLYIIEAHFQCFHMTQRNLIAFLFQPVKSPIKAAQFDQFSIVLHFYWTITNAQ